MLILLDCRPLQYTGPGNERTRLIFSTVATLAREGAVQWLFLVDQGYRPGQLPEEIEGVAGSVLVRRALPGRAGWKFWYDWQIPRLARRRGAEAVLLTGGIAAAAPGIPQYLWMPERANPADAGRPYLPFYRSRLAASMRRAAAVLCHSQRDRDWLAGLAGADKIAVIRPFPEESVRPLDEAEKEAVRVAVTGGREYFYADLSGAGEEEMMYLLKAFSLFKKRQHSNMRLVLTGRMAGEGGLKERLKTYKYRQDLYWEEDAAAAEAAGVAVLPGAAAARLAGAAYASLFYFEANRLGAGLLNSWKAGVPAIVAGGGPLEEMAAGTGASSADLAASSVDPAASSAAPAALVVPPGDPAGLAAQLMLIYKDERLRGDLITRGGQRLTAYSAGRSADAVRAAMTLHPVTA